MTEDEEFEFRARLEKEQAAAAVKRPSTVTMTPEPGAAQQARPSTVTMSPEPETPGRPLMDDLSRQLKRTAKIGANIATATGGAIADFGYGAAGVASNLAGKPNPLGPTSPSQLFNQRLTELGLPDAQGLPEQIADFGASILGGGVDPTINAIQKAIGKTVPAGFRTAAENETDVAKQLRDAGIKLLPSQTNSSFAMKSLEATGGSQRSAEAMKLFNQQKYQELARAENHLPPTAPLTREVLQSQAQAIAREGYGPVEQLPNIPIGGAMRTALRDIQSDLGTNQSFPLAQRDEVLREVSHYMVDGNGRLLQNFTGRDAVTAIKSLRQEASDLFNMEGGNKALAAAKDRIARALEEQIERSLGASGGRGTEMLNSFRGARVQLAKNYATQKMLADPSTGVIDATKAASAHLSGTPFTGNLLLIAKAGSPTFRKATGVPTGGDLGPFNRFDDLLMIGGLASSGAGGYGLPIAMLPPAQLGARRFIESKFGQNLMTNGGMFDAPTKQRMGIGAASLIPPLFSQGDE